MVNYGVELFTLSKDQFKLYFDTLHRLRNEIRIELVPEKKHVYVRAMDRATVCMSEMVLRVPPKEFLAFEIALESVIKLSPKKDVTFFHDGNRIILSNGDFALKVTELDPRVTKLREVAKFPTLAHTAKLYLDKPTIEKWYEYFKVINAGEGVRFIVKDKQLTVSGVVENSDELEMPVAIPVDGEDSNTRYPLEPITDAFAHYKVYDTATVYLGNKLPLQLELGSDLLSIKTGIAPRLDGDEDFDE